MKVSPALRAGVGDRLGEPVKPDQVGDLHHHLLEREYRRDIGEDPRKVVRAVFRVLSNRMSEGEIRDVVNMLPSQIRALWP